MQIIKYTSEVQKKLGSKVKPEPWLHVALQSMRFTDGRDDHLIYEGGGAVKRRIFPLYYAIYIWDTRKTLETGVIKGGSGVTGPRTADNGKRLKGGAGIDKDILGIFNAEATFNR